MPENGVVRDPRGIGHVYHELLVLVLEMLDPGGLRKLVGFLCI